MGYLCAQLTVETGVQAEAAAAKGRQAVSLADNVGGGGGGGGRGGGGGGGGSDGVGGGAPVCKAFIALQCLQRQSLRK